MDLGEKIRRLRVEKQLTQEELANRCELSKGFISQIENNLTSPSIATLVDLLEILGTDLKEFFNESHNERITFTNDDMFESENKDLNNITKWIVPNAQKNEMEPILVTLFENGCTKEEKPHEGEEFGFVISGAVFVNMGNEKYKVKKGESFYFKPRRSHFLSNAGKKTAKIIWVSTPPTF
ncbi:MAG: cupin domain-containing protein [Clostridioides sp.]|jgi:transcriptional regulator with XRE-family HTH domain|nr:cupin domain-containing protein [Clostridioides sp.]